MTHRKQFTFYGSYYLAVQSLPRSRRLPMLTAIIEYALYRQTQVELRPEELSMFTLIRPTLDAARRKAMGGETIGKRNKGWAKLGESPGKA